MNVWITFYEDTFETGETARTVNARDLWDFVGSRKDFSSWIKTKINYYGFVEGTDYLVFTQLGGNPSGGRPLTEYHLSIDTAKEIAMVENNDRGRKIRRYFIDVEKEWKSGLDAKKLSRLEILQMAIDSEKENEKLKIEAKENEPKVEMYESVMKADGLLTMNQVAKIISSDDYPIGRNQLFSWLREKKYLIAKGPDYNTPYECYKMAGYFVVKMVTVNDRMKSQTYVTPRGLECIAKRIRKAG